MSRHEGAPMTNRTEAEGWLEQVTAALIDGTTDRITPIAAAAAVTHALLDVADAIREQTDKMQNEGIRALTERNS